MELKDDRDFAAIRVEVAFVPVAVPSPERVFALVMPQHLFGEFFHVVPSVGHFDVEVVAEALAVSVASGNLVRVNGCGDVGGDVWLVHLHKGFSHLLRPVQQVFRKLCDLFLQPKRLPG